MPCSLRVARVDPQNTKFVNALVFLVFSVSQDLSVIFGPALLRPACVSLQSIVDMPRVHHIVYLLLAHAAQIFPDAANPNPNTTAATTTERQGKNPLDLLCEVEEEEEECRAALVALVRSVPPFPLQSLAGPPRSAATTSSCPF